jgi:CRP/FNR family cyclic AMP-dependent transcriptional regulator
MKTVWYLEKVDLYEVLCPYKYDDHLRAHPLHRYNKRDFLFLPDDPARDIYLIDKGKVKVGFYDEIGDEHVSAILGRGEILGEMAILGLTRHRDFAEVLEDDTRVCKLSVEKAIELTRDYKNFALEINKRIGERVKRLERRIEILLFKDARQRLMEFLKDLLKECGKPCEGKVLVLHNYTQQDIASLIGVSRKTASLLLNELEEKGLISMKRGQILFHHSKGLTLAAAIDGSHG